MAPKLIAAILTALILLTSAAVIFMMMLIGMNGFSGSDASWGMGAYVAMTLIIVLISAFAAWFGTGYFVGREMNSILAVIIPVAILSLLAVVLEVAAAFAGVIIADIVRTKF